MDWRVLRAQHAAERAAAVTYRQMARGLDGLATVAATAFFVGTIGTLCGMVNSFVGGGGERSTYMAAIVALLADSLMPCVAGLAVAITASTARQYLSARLDYFDMEMRNAAREMPGYLAPLTRP
jgi:biopolymer transport protein ExbB/TolQ